MEAAHFVPIGIETTGVFGSEANYFLHKLDVCLKTESRDPRAYHFLLQRIAVVIQHGNAAAELGSCSVNDNHIYFNYYNCYYIIIIVSYYCHN